MIGILQRLPFGPGGWKICCSNGDEYELIGVVPAHLAGKKVRIKGTKSENQGYLMSGLPQIEVEEISAA